PTQIVPKAFYRRRLPHLQRDYKHHFVTFCTHARWILPKIARQIVLECCIYEHERTMDLKAVIVMPDHVHLIFVPLIDENIREVCSLARIMNAIKGASAHKINRALQRSGKIWQTESFDHLVRSSESLDSKIQYVLENPVRRGLVDRWEEYPW